MNNEKIQIVLSGKEEAAEIVLREGAAIKLLDPKPPVKTDISGVLWTPAEYLTKRVNAGQFTQELSHILVDRNKIQIKLVINENDEYVRGTVVGTLETNPKFAEFGINAGKVWTPVELGLFFKMNRAFFPDRNTNMKLVSELMNFTATVNSKIERSAKENGNVTDNFAQVVDSNLPASFTLEIAIFKGAPTEILEVETVAKIDGRDVAFMLISPSANQILEDVRDDAIDAELAKIRDIAPNIAIIEV
jgi:hypothetical protein